MFGVQYLNRTVLMVAGTVHTVAGSALLPPLTLPVIEAVYTLIRIEAAPFGKPIMLRWIRNHDLPF